MFEIKKILLTLINTFSTSCSTLIILYIKTHKCEYSLINNSIKGKF